MSRRDTWINYSYNNKNTKLYIGDTSKYEIETDKRNFDGMTADFKIEDLIKIKITFYEMTDNLLLYLKAAANSLSGVMFWDEENLARGIYQAYYFQDECTQLAYLELYQKNTQPVSQPWPGEELQQGRAKRFIFGKGNFKINGFEFPAGRSLIEKTIDKEIEQYRFNGNYRYFITDKPGFKVCINDTAGIENSLTLLKNRMVDFTPHTDKPEIVYSGYFLDYTVISEQQNRKVEIILTRKPPVNCETSTVPDAPVIQVIDNKIIMIAQDGCRIYYTSNVHQQPPAPNNSSLEYLNPLNWYYGYYKAIAIRGERSSAITGITISPSSVEKPTITKTGSKIEMAGHPDADIYYTYNAANMPPDPNSGSTKYTAAIEYQTGYYKAVSKLVETYSPVTDKAFISATDDAIHIFPLESDYSDQGSQPYVLDHYNTSFSEGGVLIGADGMLQLGTSLKEPNLTVSMWVKRNTLTDKACLLSNDYSARRHLSVGDTTNKNLICAYNSGFYKTGYDLPLGTWVLLTITIEPTNQNRQQVFVNGVLKSTLSIPWNMSTQGIKCIGGNIEDTGFAFRGIIKKVRMYSRVLSAAEILEIYNQG